MVRWGSTGYKHKARSVFPSCFLKFYNNKNNKSQQSPSKALYECSPFTDTDSRSIQIHTHTHTHTHTHRHIYSLPHLNKTLVSSCKRLHGHTHTQPHTTTQTKTHHTRL